MGEDDVTRPFLCTEFQKSELTCIHSLFSLFVPREAGLLHFGVRSTYVLGLQIGSILSRLTAVALAKAVYSDQD